MEDVRVISGDKDGTDLRREKTKGRYYLRCDGAADDAEINEAISTVGGQQWFIRAEDYERIFGGKD